MNIQKRRTIMKSFVTSQFSYFSLIWMFYSGSNIQERALRITYQDNAPTFQELLNKDNPVSMHHRNLQVLVTEMFKIHWGLSAEILRETFLSKTIRIIFSETICLKKCTLCHHDTESLSFLVPKIWDSVRV